MDYEIRLVTIEDYDKFDELLVDADGVVTLLVEKAEEALKKEGINKIFGLVFKDNDPANAFWEAQGYSLRTNLNYRNKSLNEGVPTGE